jgi:hypothetical protein
MEASINSIIKTALLPCDRHIFQDQEYACNGMDESQNGDGNEISRPGTSKTQRRLWETSKPSRHPTHFSSNTKMFYCRSKAKQIRGSCGQLMAASSCRKHLRECQENKTLSMLKTPEINRLLGTKCKRYSKKGKFCKQESSSESDMEIEFENDDFGDDISDGDADSAYLAQGFCRMTNMAKNGLNV